MDILEYLRKSAAKLIISPKTSEDTSSPSNVNVNRPADDFRLMAVITHVGDSVRSNGAQKLKDYVPDPDRRHKIARILTNLGKFAVDSAVDQSLKGVIGGVQVYKIVKEGLKDEDPPSLTSNGNKKPDLTLVMEEVQAKMEKMQEEMNNIKQQNEISAQCTQGSEPPLKESAGDPTVGSAPTKTDGKRFMIRSRL